MIEKPDVLLDVLLSIGCLLFCGAMIYLVIRRRR